MKYRVKRRPDNRDMAELSRYPIEWENDEKMNVMFSPFRENRNLNPHSWDSKLKFWSQMIMHECFRNKCAILNSKSLPGAFERKGKFPTCLDVVMREMLKTGHLQPLSSFAVDTSWSAWAVDVFVKRPVSWGFDLLIKKPLAWTASKVFGSSEKEGGGEELVLVNLVKSISEQILARHTATVEHASTDNVVEYARLEHLCQDLCGDSRTFQLAVLQLCKEGKCAVVHTKQGEKLVSFSRQSELPKQQLTDNDMRIYRLKLAENTLNQQIFQLNDGLLSLRQEAKQLVARGDKSQAKACLVRKHRLEKQKEDKEQSLEQIQHLLHIIQQADTQKQILDAYRSGKEAFSDIKQRYGLTTDIIDNVMDGIQEVFDEQSELERSMSQPLSPSTLPDVSQDDLEAELDSILAGTPDMSPQKGEASPSMHPHQDMVNAMCRMSLVEDQDMLPDVPTHDPARPIPQSFTPPRPSAAQSPVGFSSWSPQSQGQKMSPTQPQHSSPVKERKPEPVAFLS